MAPILESSSEGHGLFNANGEEWEEMRRFTLLAFRSLGVGRDLMEKRTMDELDRRCAQIDKEAVNGKSVVWMSKLFDLTVGSVLNKVLIGKRFDDENTEEYLSVKQISDSSAGTNTLFDTTVSVWLLKRFFSSRFRTTTAARSGIVDFVADEVNRRYRAVQEGKHSANWDEPEDFVDAFIAKMEMEKERDGTNVYSLDGLKVLLLDLWQAGQSTTSTTLKAGFNHLASHPEVVSRVRHELLRITQGGSRPLALLDRPNTPYLNATIAEIQRHASLLNVNYWRITHEPVEIKGFHVDSGSIICAQLSCYHANDTIFKDPSEFKPERFLEDEKLISQLIPFGIGKRSCVGENVARTQLYLILGNLLLRYDFKVLGPTPTVFDSVPYSFNRIPDTSVKMEFTKL